MPINGPPSSVATGRVFTAFSSTLTDIDVKRCTIRSQLRSRSRTWREASVHLSPRRRAWDPRQRPSTPSAKASIFRFFAITLDHQFVVVVYQRESPPFSSSPTLFDDITLINALSTYARRGAPSARKLAPANQLQIKSPTVDQGQVQAGESGTGNADPGYVYSKWLCVDLFPLVFIRRPIYPRFRQPYRWAVCAEW